MDYIDKNDYYIGSLSYFMKIYTKKMKSNYHDQTSYSIEDIEDAGAINEFSDVLEEFARYKLHRM